MSPGATIQAQAHRHGVALVHTDNNAAVRGVHGLPAVKAFVKTDMRARLIHSDGEQSDIKICIP